MLALIVNLFKLHETKLKLSKKKKEYQLKTGNQNTSCTDEASISEVKLPNLVITNFNVTFADRPTFWGQHSETIDDRVCNKTIDALPHTAEGYNRVVATPKERFGKESDPRFALRWPTANPKRIYKIFDRLSHRVQSLETLKQIKKRQGNDVIDARKTFKN